MLRGLGTPGRTRSARPPNPTWMPKIPPTSASTSTSTRPSRSSTRRATRTPTATASARCRAAASPLKFRYAVRSEGRPTRRRRPSSSPAGCSEIGIATTQKIYNDSQLTEVIGKGDYDMFVWGWTPFVDPDPMLSYFTCDQVSQDPKDPTNYYNDANWCDPTYDALYKQQKVELDPAKRMQIVHQMLTRFYESAARTCCCTTGRPAGLPHGQVHGLDPPAGGDRAGAVHQLVADLREPEAASRRRRRPAAAAVAARAAIIAIVVVAVVVLGGVGLVLAAPAERRRATNDAGVSATVRHRQGAGVAGDAVLRRLLQLLPVPGGRGRPGREPVPRPQPDATQRDALTQAVRPRRVDAASSSCATWSRRRSSTSAARTRRTSRCRRRSASKAWADDRARRDLDAAVDGLRRADRHRRGVATRDEGATTRRRRSRWRRTRCPTSGSGMLLLSLFAVDARLVPGRRHRGPDVRRDRRRAARSTRPSTCSCPALTLTLAYLGEYALVMRSSLLDTMREDYLVLARAKGLREIARAQPPRGAERAAAGRDAHRDQLRLRPVRARSRSRRSSPGPASAWRPTTRSTGPDLPMLQGLFLVFSAAVIVVQPPRRPALRLPRPAGADGMSAVALASARRIAWRRRRRSAAAAWRAVPRQPRRDGRPRRSSSCSWLLALAAPLLADHAGSHAVNTTAQPGLGEPVRVRPARHRPPRAQRVDAVRLGLADQPARRPRRDGARDGDRLARRRSSPGSSAAGSAACSCGSRSGSS